MSILFIMFAATAGTAVTEAATEAIKERKHRRSIRPYRKPDVRYRHKKSPSASQAYGLFRLYLF